MNKAYNMIKSKHAKYSGELAFQSQQRKQRKKRNTNAKVKKSWKKSW